MPVAGQTVVPLRTAAWYGDSEVEVAFPPRWRVEVHRPKAARTIGPDGIARALERPVGGPAVAALAKGKSKPLIIVDDLSRPTPAQPVLDVLLRRFADVGVPLESVSILLATGTHGGVAPTEVRKKVGELAASRCRILVHDDRRDVVRVGYTRFGTPVLVNREVARSDLVLGIGGLYPQHSTGFGGGTKLALGVLGRRSIMQLHYGHKGVGGTHNIDNDFRRDLDEIAALIGLRTTITLIVGAERQIINVIAGDPATYYRDAVATCRLIFATPAPEDADVVVANAYPMDVSLTVTHSKGMTPLSHAAPGASRIVVAACPEGIGHHGLFPYMNPPRFYPLIQRVRTARAKPREVPSKIRSRLSGTLGRLRARTPAGPAGPDPVGPVWLWRPTEGPSLRGAVSSIRATSSWESVIDAVTREQAGREELRVAVYPCAALQVLEASRRVSGQAAMAIGE